MAESIGAAVFTVDADISRFDAKLTEAQSRATRAVAGINSSLQSVQGTDVVINKVGTLNLQSEIGQIEAYKAQLENLRGQLAALEAAQAKARMTWQPTSDISRASPARSKNYQQLNQFVEQKREIETEIKDINQKLVRAEEAATLGITRTMIVRNSAMDQFQAKLASYKRQQSELQKKAVSEMTIGTPEGLAKYELEMKSLQRKISAMESSKFGRLLNLEKDIAQTEILKKELDSLKIKLATLRQNAVSNLAISTPEGLAKFQADTQAVQSRIIALEKELEIIVKSTTASIENSMSRRALAFQSSGRKATAGIQQISREEALALAKANRTSGTMTSAGGGTSLFFADKESHIAAQNINKIGDAANKAHTPVGLFERAVGRLSRTLFAFVGVTAFIELVTGIYSAIAAGVEFNKTIENTRIGMAALLESEGKFTQMGRTLSGAESMNAALSESNKIIKQLQYDNLQTIATFEQLARAYQSALAPGLAVGFSLGQIREFTLAMVQAASAMQLPFEQMAEEIRSLLRGTITPRNTIIATNLGITNEDIRRYKGDAQGLFDFVMGKLSEFTKYGPILQHSFSGLYSNMVDMFRLASGEAAAPFFDYLKGLFYDITQKLVIVNKQTRELEVNPQVKESWSGFFGLMELGVKAVVGISEALLKIITIPASALEPFIRFANSFGKIDIDKIQKLKEAMEAASKAGKLTPETPTTETPKDLFLKSNAIFTEDQWNSYVDSFNQNLADRILDLNKKKSELYDVLYSDVPVDPAVFKDAVSQSIELDREINKLSESIMNASDGSQGFTNGLAIMETSLGNIVYKVNDAKASFKDFAAAVREAGGLDLTSAGNNLDREIDRLKGELQAHQEGKIGPKATIEGRYAQRVGEAAKTVGILATKTSSPSLVEKGYVESSEYVNKAAEARDMALQVQAYKDQEAAARKKSGGGGRPVSVEKMANEMRALEKEKEQWNQKFLDMNTEYEIKMLEVSGNALDAQLKKIDQQANKEKQTYQQNIDDLQAKITEYQAKNLDENARNELNKTATMLDYLKGRQEEYNSKIDRQIDLEKEIATIQDKAQKTKDIADLNLQYAELVGSKEDILLYTLQQIEAEAALQKIQNPKQSGLIDQIKEAKIRREEAFKGNSWSAGFFQAADDARRELPTMGRQGADAFKMISDSISDAADTLTEFITTGEASFSDFATSIIKDLIRIQIQAMLNQALLGSSSGGGLGGILGGIAGLFGISTGGGFTSSATALAGMDLSWTTEKLVSQFHNGTANVSKMVPSSYFFQAPRLHDGLAADEYPAILQKGEKVIPKNKSSEPERDNAPIVNMINNTGEKMDKPNVQSRYDTGQKRFVLDIVLKGMEKNIGGFRDSMKSMGA